MTNRLAIDWEREEHTIVVLGYHFVFQPQPMDLVRFVDTLPSDASVTAVDLTDGFFALPLPQRFVDDILFWSRLLSEVQPVVIAESIENTVAVQLRR